MINLKGIVFNLPQYTLYMNGTQIWKRSDNIDNQDKWVRLHIQLDFETEERIAKFSIGKDIIEFVGVGIKNLPKDIKVVAMSQGSFKVYKADHQERKGEELTQLFIWSI
ncbi:MAG: hypothetical protein EZS28_007304 [Streblomastix strix]|uniref:Uncharacterized protein n=1 Tax=Streblomastix strix TaxID=222440 RepID=A0A5J4WRX7_9EUKA|nr:MAG: hypothetical protein EZS28_007304 [Streblomastix strix]